MAKFCTQCGKPLEEGEICSCQLSKNIQEDIRIKTDIENEKVYEENQEKNENSINNSQQTLENGAKYFTNVWENFIGIIKKPVSYGTTFVEKGNVKDSWGLIGAQAIVQAVFILLILQKVNVMIGAVGGLFGTYVDDLDLNNLGQSAQGILKLSYAKGFILTVIVSIILSLLYAGILLGITKLMKQTGSFQKMFCVSAVKSTVCIAITVIAIILFILNSTVGIYIFLLGDLLSVCFTMAVMPREVAKDTAVLIVFFSVFLFMIASIIVCYNFLPFYLPDVVRDGFTQFKPYIRNPFSLYDKFAGVF